MVLAGPVVGVPSGGEAGLPGAGSLRGVHRGVSGLEQLERLTVVDGVDEGYPGTCSDGGGGVAVVDGNGCCAVQLVDVTIKVLPCRWREEQYGELVAGQPSDEVVPPKRVPACVSRPSSAPPT